MDIILIIFSILFLLHFLQYYKAKKTLNNRLKYTLLVGDLINYYKVFLEKSDEIKEYKYIYNFLETQLNEIDMLLNIRSFDDIFYRKNKMQSNKQNETMKILDDLNKAPLDVKNIFLKVLDTKKQIFENSKVEIKKYIKIKGKNYIRGLIAIQIIKRIFLDFKNINIKNIKQLIKINKKEEEILYKDKFKIVY